MTDIPKIAYSEDEEEGERRHTVLHDLLSLRPRTQSRPCLVVVSGPRSVGKVFRLTKPETTIGRSVGCDIVLNEDGVSRLHAKVTLSATGEVAILDAGASNGLVFEGSKVQRHVMHDGHTVVLGDTALALLHIDDVDEALRQNLLESAVEDPETRLFVRKHFRGLLTRELAHAAKYGTRTSILLAAFDGYKSFVDENPPGALGAAVRKLADVVRSIVAREEILVARYGEEQIIVGLPETTLQEVATCGEWLRKAIESARFGPNASALTITCGVATTPPDGRIGLDDLLQRAERSLYRGKLAGGNCVGPDGE